MLKRGYYVAQEECKAALAKETEVARQLEADIAAAEVRPGFAASGNSYIIRNYSSLQS